MELQFQKSMVSCLDPVVQEVQNMELTQELRLSDSMPDIGRILCAWGQPILRGKEWRGTEGWVSGGMMVWVLYAPEDGSRERCIEGWIPFQLRWDIPEGTPEGVIRVLCRNRFVDARSLSARKLLVRSGVGALGQILAPVDAEIWLPDSEKENVELLRRLYPVRIRKEAGETTFRLEEDLVLPSSSQRPVEIIRFSMEPKLTDKKILGNKAVFRGEGCLHVLYREEGGRLCSWTFSIPFSQFAQLEAEYGGDAQPDVILSPTGMELELDEQGTLRLRSTVAAQYLITDRQYLELIEDAYSPGRELQLQRQTVSMPVVLETRRENLYGEQTLPVDGNQLVDVEFLPDFPRIRRSEGEISLETPGQFQVLSYGEDGNLQAAAARWEDSRRLAADESTELTAVPLPGEQPEAIAGSGQIQASGELPLELTSGTRQELTMVTGLELGEERRPDPNRPSLILRRCGDRRLWDIAKESGSTMEVIRRVNGLQEEPAPERILLIPVL